MSTTSPTRAGTSGSRQWLVAIGFPLFLVSAVLVPAAAPDQQGLDQMLAAYAGGDHNAVTRLLARSSDFQKYQLADLKSVEKWLGKKWDRMKAAVMIEVIDRGSQIALAYGLGLLPIGQRYILSRPDAPGVSAADDALERRWHLIALGGLQRRILAADVGRYLDELEKRRPMPASASIWDPRIAFARAVGQEQTCRLMHATARVDRLLAELEGLAASTPTAERQAAIECVQASLASFEGAAKFDDTRDEARIRAGFAQFQLGHNEDAQKSLDGANPGADRMLAYWRSLFRGRVADALGDYPEGERAYRAALEQFPDAHSASVGLALSLFRLRKDDEAEAAVQAVRKRALGAVDPWESYFQADGRLVERWIAELRGGLK